MAAALQNAQWIFVKNTAGEVHDKYYDYKAEFTAEKGNTCIHISAHSNYALYINGQFVDCGQLPDYEWRQIYDTLDITSFVRPGVNTLELTQYVAGRAFSTGRPAVPGVIFEVYQDDKLLLKSDEKVLSGHNPRYASLKEEISGQCGYNWDYDATGPATVFEESVAANKPKNLIPRPIRKVAIEPFRCGTLKTQGVFIDTKQDQMKNRKMQTAYLSTMLRYKLIEGSDQRVSLWGGDHLRHTDLSYKIPEDLKADGAYFVYDLGTEYAGFAELELEVPEDTQVLVGYGEHLDDLRVRSKVGRRSFCFGFKAKKGKNTFCHPLQRIAGRYLQVHIYSREGIVNRVGILPANYPLNHLKAPVTDGLDKWIWDVGCKTLELCMHEHYEDCPWREQALYSMDSRVQMLCGYYAFGEYAFARESLRNLVESLRPDGLIELCAPGLVGLNIPGYTAILPRQILEYTQYSGDESLIRECFDSLTVIAQKMLERIDEKGLFAGHQGDEYWHFYEWRPGMHTLGITEPGFYEAPMQALVASCFNSYADICELLGEDGSFWKKAAKDLLQNAHNTFFDPATGAYKTRPDDVSPRHELTQALMLWAGGVPKEHTASVEQAILSEKLIRTSLSMTIFTYEALLQNPANGPYILKQIRSFWGRMLAAGAQTFWETEDGSEDFDRSGSLCHGWSAVPIYIYSRYGALLEGK